jgi:hypothetical protein
MIRRVPDPIRAILDWAAAHEALLWWMAGLSLAALIAAVVAVPLIVVRIPRGYFRQPRRIRVPLAERRHPLLRVLLLLAKNALAAAFVAAGVAMLVLPGQGILTLLVGVMLADFPGKYRIERWLVSRPPVLRGVNWLRRRAGRPPLELDRRERSRPTGTR